MVTITHGITDDNLHELYSHPSIQKISHDHRGANPIIHPMVSYYSAFKGAEFMGAYMVIRLSPIDYEAHMLLLPKATKLQREFGYMFLESMFEQTDSVPTIIIDGMETAKNHVTKMGFKLEGIKREAFQQNGIKKDAYMYGLLKSEFKERKWEA